MKRYMPDGPYPTTTEHAEGDYVLYEEAAALLAEKDREIAHLTEQRDSWKDEVMRARPVAFEIENNLVKKFYPQFVCLEGRERLNMILASVTGLVSGLKANSELQEQLRASNEQLVAAQTRIKSLHKYLNNSGLFAIWVKSDNLTALAEHDKEVAANAYQQACEACVKLVDVYVDSLPFPSNPQGKAMMLANSMRMLSSAELRATVSQSPDTTPDKRDAARYRTLRSQHWSDGGLCVTHADGVKLGHDCPSEDRLDEAVDYITKSAELRAKG